MCFGRFCACDLHKGKFIGEFSCYLSGVIFRIIVDHYYLLGKKSLDCERLKGTADKFGLIMSGNDNIEIQRKILG